MAKFVCLFALAGLAAAGPLSVTSRVSSLNQDGVISNIMMSLQPSIDAAIAKALGEASFSSVTVQETVGPVSFSGSAGNTEYQGSYGSKQSSSSSSFESSSGSGSGSQFQSAGIGGVVFHNGAAAAGGQTGFSAQASGNQGFTGHAANVHHQAKQQSSNVGSGSAHFSAGHQVSQGATTGVKSGSTFQSAGTGGVVFHNSAAAAGDQTGFSAQHVANGHHQAAQQSSNVGSAHFGHAVNQGATTGAKSGSTFQSAGVSGVVHHNSGSSAKQQTSSNSAKFSAVNNQAVNANYANAAQVSNVKKVTTTSVSSNNQQNLVQGVLTALIPSVEAAVQAALLQMKQSSVASTTIQSQGGQLSTSTGSAQISGVTTVTETTSISAAEESALVAKIIQVLTPSITTSVRNALAARIETVTTSQQSSTGSNQQFGAQSFNQQSAFGANKQSASTTGSQIQTAGVGGVVFHGSSAAAGQSGISAQISGGNQQSSATTSQINSNTQSTQSSSSSSNVSSSKLVSQIVAALRPSISLSVAEALEASRLANAQNSFSTSQTFTSGSQASQDSSYGFNSGSSSVQSTNFNAGGATSSSLSSESLSGIFGDGSIHNVRVETPEYKIEYNN